MTTDHDTESTLQKLVAADNPRGQTTPLVTRQRAAHHGRNLTREAAPNAEPQGKAEYRPFAEALRAAMEAADMSASELARQIWGSTTDKRGYSVARNRDRIGHYLNATSYPEPANLDAMAQALGVPVEALAIERPTRDNPGPRSRTASTSLHLSEVQDQQHKLRLQVDKIIDWQLAMYIGQLIKVYDAGGQILIPNTMPGTVLPGTGNLPETVPTFTPGTVINGDRDKNGTDNA